MATQNDNSDSGGVPVANKSRQLVGIGGVVPDRVAMSRRGWIRACDSGMAPPGYKIGARRMWDLAQIDAWIAGGCKPVRAADGGAR